MQAGKQYNVQYDTARILRTMLFFEKVEDVRQAEYVVDQTRLDRYE